MPTQGWLLTQSWCEIGNLQIFHRWVTAVFSAAADHEIFRMLFPLYICHIPMGGLWG